MKTQELISTNYVEQSGNRYVKVTSVNSNGEITYRNPIIGKHAKLQKELYTTKSKIVYDSNYTCSKLAIERHKNANVSVLDKQYKQICNKPKELRAFMEVANKCISTLM